MNSGVVVWPLFNSLQAFWPGLQVRVANNNLNALCDVPIFLSYPKQFLTLKIESATVCLTSDCKSYMFL
jgi:hypothetical protein